MSKYNDKNGNIVEVNKDYDFTNETVAYLKKSLDKSDPKLEKVERYLKQEPGIERHILYKMNFTSQDPDEKSHLLQQVYKDKWNAKYLEVCKKEKEYVHSDTMTSVQDLLNKFYETVCSTEWEKYKDKWKKEIKKEVKHCSKAGMDRIINDIKEHGVNENNKMFNKYFKENKIIIDFIKYYHTIGNYIPVPHNFNSKRSGPGKHADYDMWDLTLTKIYDYYKYIKEKNKKAANDALKDLLHIKNFDESNEGVFKSTEKWLKEFKSWPIFIRENYLQDFVNLKNSDWPIKDEFKKFHNWDNRFPNDCLGYFKCVTKTIIKRADNILKGKKIEIKDETL